MKKKIESNVYDGYITKNNTVCFGDGEFVCDVTQLYPGSIIDEEGYLVTDKGEKIDLTDVDVSVEVGLKSITIEDVKHDSDIEYDDNYGAIGKIIQIIYKEGRMRRRHDNPDLLYPYRKHSNKQDDKFHLQERCAYILEF